MAPSVYTDIMKAKKVDINQKDIVSTLRKFGVSVFCLHEVGRGCPDLLCGFGGKTFLAEVKRDKRATFTKHQVEFMLKWHGGEIHRLESEDDALELIKSLKSGKC